MARMEREAATPPARPMSASSTAYRICIVVFFLLSESAGLLLRPVRHREPRFLSLQPTPRASLSTHTGFYQKTFRRKVNVFCVGERRTGAEERPGGSVARDMEIVASSLMQCLTESPGRPIPPSGEVEFIDHSLDSSVPSQRPSDSSKSASDDSSAAVQVSLESVLAAVNGEEEEDSPKGFVAHAEERTRGSQGSHLSLSPTTNRRLDEQQRKGHKWNRKNKLDKSINNEEEQEQQPRKVYTPKPREHVPYPHTFNTSELPRAPEKKQYVPSAERLEQVAKKVYHPSGLSAMNETPSFNGSTSSVPVVPPTLKKVYTPKNRTTAPPMEVFSPFDHEDVQKDIPRPPTLEKSWSPPTSYSKQRPSYTPRNTSRHVEALPFFHEDVQKDIPRPSTFENSRSSPSSHYKPKRLANTPRNTSGTSSGISVQTWEETSASSLPLAVIPNGGQVKRVYVPKLRLEKTRSRTNNTGIESTKRYTPRNIDPLSSPLSEEANNISTIKRHFSFRNNATAANPRKLFVSKAKRLGEPVESLFEQPKRYDPRPKLSLQSPKDENAARSNGAKRYVANLIKRPGEVVPRPWNTTFNVTQGEPSPNTEKAFTPENVLVSSFGVRKYIPKFNLKTAANDSSQIGQRKILKKSPIVLPASAPLLSEERKIYVPKLLVLSKEVRDAVNEQWKSRIGELNLEKNKALENPGLPIFLKSSKRMLSYKYPKVISLLKQEWMEKQPGRDESSPGSSSPESAANQRRKQRFEGKAPETPKEIEDDMRSSRRRGVGGFGGVERKRSKGDDDVDGDGDFAPRERGGGRLKVPLQFLLMLNEEGYQPQVIADFVFQQFGVRVSARSILQSLSRHNTVAKESTKDNFHRGRRRSKGQPEKVEEEEEEIPTIVCLPLADNIAIRDLAELMDVPASKLIKHLMMNEGIMLTITQSIKRALAIKTIESFGMRWEDDVDEEAFAAWEEHQQKKEAARRVRPPVVTIMGHVDHGKTSLLDRIRNSRVAQSEAGGITQSISAFQVQTEQGRDVTFIDTPGHAAFSDMRKRGARVTDLVVLVVAADDGIMEQTLECIQAARESECPIVVAINKVDKATPAQIDKVKQDLLNAGITVEDYGGETQCAEVSAKTGTGIDGLLEKILLQADVMQLSTDDEATLEASVVEARVDKGMGVAATAIIRDGLIKVGDHVVAGSAWGRVRALLDHRNQRVEKASGAMPIQIVGFSTAPVPGDKIILAVSEEEARRVAATRKEYSKSASVAASSGALVNHAVEAFGAETFDAREVINIPIIIKGDVGGSVEAICSSIALINATDPSTIVRANVVHHGIGEVTTSDVDTASATKAVVLTFNVGASVVAMEEARSNNVEIKQFKVLYDLLNEVRTIVKNTISPPVQGTLLGAATVKKVFTLGKLGKIAGCEVTEGTMIATSRARVIRGGKSVVYDGSLSSLKIVKTDAAEVPAGKECGIGLKDFADIAEGDVIQCYQP